MKSFAKFAVHVSNCLWSPHILEHGVGQSSGALRIFKSRHRPRCTQNGNWLHVCLPAALIVQVCYSAALTLYRFAWLLLIMVWAGTETETESGTETRTGTLTLCGYDCHLIKHENTDRSCEEEEDSLFNQLKVEVPLRHMQVLLGPSNASFCKQMQKPKNRFCNRTHGRHSGLSYLGLTLTWFSILVEETLNPLSALSLG